MGKEDKIKCQFPPPQKLQALLQRLPSPIRKSPLSEIYNYKIEKDGFYFVDHLVDSATASVAFRIFVDAALASNQIVEISEP
jgi:hypothetical protein